MKTLNRPRPRSTDVPDTALVERARDGDRGAFATLYERHAPAIARLARARVQVSDVDDVVAEVFVRAWRSLGKYEDHGVPFVGWLYGICRNVAADHHRKGWRMKPTEEPRTGMTPDHGANAARDIDLERALTVLGDNQRQVIELKYFAGLSNDEVASVLGTSPGAVNTLQWRALRSLERELGGTRD